MLFGSGRLQSDSYKMAGIKRSKQTVSKQYIRCIENVHSIQSDFYKVLKNNAFSFWHVFHMLIIKQNNNILKTFKLQHHETSINFFIYQVN